MPYMGMAKNALDSQGIPTYYCACTAYTVIGNCETHVVVVFKDYIWYYLFSFFIHTGTNYYEVKKLGLKQKENPRTIYEKSGISHIYVYLLMYLYAQRIWLCV